jgi:hypothetical protein
MATHVTWGNDVAAVRKRVYYEGTNDIYEGMPVCYNWDTTDNWTGYGEATLGADPTEQGTTAEGEQNEGKFIRVEDPASANLQWLAGFVAFGSPGIGSAGPHAIDIYVPNGAIVPVRTDVNCTVGRTVLCISNASQALTSTGRPVAVAMETVDRTTTTGICLAKIDPSIFVYQENGSTSLLIDDEAGAVADTVNTIDLYFAGTGGPKRGLYAVGEIAGAGHANYGMWKFRTYLNAAASQTVHALCANLHLKDNAELTDTGEYASASMYVTVETEVTTTAPDLSGGSLAGIYFGYYVDESTGAPANAYLFQTNTRASYSWDGILRMQNAGDLGDTPSGGDEANHVVGFDGDGETRKIPVDIAGTTYYLLVGTAIQNVADA